MKEWGGVTCLLEEYAYIHGKDTDLLGFEMKDTHTQSLRREGIEIRRVSKVDRVALLKERLFY